MKHRFTSSNGWPSRAYYSNPEDLLRACIIDFKGNYDKHLPLVDFAYNSSFTFIHIMDPFEALYGRRCRSPIGWFELGEPSLLGPDLIYKTLDKVHIIRNRLQTTYSWQKSYTDHRRRDLEFEECDKVYFWKFSLWKGWLDFARKRCWVLVMWVPMNLSKGW